MEGMGNAAVDLAIAAAGLRDADDALVAFGRSVALAHGRSYVPRVATEAERAEALHLCAVVADAYERMRGAELAFFELGGPRTSAGEGQAP